jgi:signal transduction histidine kinase
LLGFGIMIVFTGLVRKDRLLKYPMLGYLFLIVMSIFSLLIAIFHWRPFPVGSILNRSLVLYEAGIVIELIFFLVGLSYKNRNELIIRTAEREKLKLENERKELDQQIAIMQAQQEERNRISVDMHDELGGGMTAIRLMSELALNKSKENAAPELERISASANDLLIKMNAIIWSMSQSNDSLANLLAYIRGYSLEYFENTSIPCTVEIPMEIPTKEMSGEKRRNTFLTVKETLNNTLKHSKATRVNIQISLNGTLQITIHDNGTGIQMEKLRQFGNGLRNMKKRIENIGGVYQITNNEGTRTYLDIPL